MFLVKIIENFLQKVELIKSTFITELLQYRNCVLFNMVDVMKILMVDRMRHKWVKINKGNIIGYER